jgi:hypothetical protein
MERNPARLPWLLVSWQPCDLHELKRKAAADTAKEQGISAANSINDEQQAAVEKLDE